MNRAALKQRPQEGLGEDGKTLKQVLQENERLYRETGCYAGVKDPHLMRDDPVRYEIFHSRMLAALIAGRETTRMISGSPFVREVAELVLGLYTPEGDNIAQSTGIQVHVKLMGDNIKWMIHKNYEEEVGIRDGDFFLANEPVISGMHGADVYDILPIFWKQELIGWVVTAIMEMDIGAVSPACMPTANVERGSDGLKFCCERVGSNDRLHRDFEHKIEMSLDMPDIFLLDRKGAIAANIRVREEMKNVIREFGLDYYKRATREIIEEERRNQLARIRQRTIPGCYRSVVPIEIPMAKMPVTWLPANRDTIRLIPVRMDIGANGRVALDFDGAGEWGWHPFNFTPNAAWGGLCVTAAQTLSYDGRGNHGSLLPFDIKEPAKDSILNPSQIKKLATSSPWVTALDIYGMWQSMLSSAYYLRGFREEAFNWRSSSGWQMAGYDQYGNKRPMMWFGTGAFGPGATGVCDGVDGGGFVATAEADLGNEEIWELFVPQLAMGRRLDPYSQGYGRYRSGLSIPTFFLLHRTTQTIASGSLGSGSDRIIPNLGQFGGYPGGKRNTMLLRFPHLKERIAQKLPLVHNLGHPAEFEQRVKEAGGTMTEYGLIPPYTEVQDGDYITTLTASAGGLGDPIDRSPALIASDMDNGLITEWQAASIYCVESKYDAKEKQWKIDEAATAERREAKRKERLARAVPVKQWWAKARRQVMDRKIDGQLLEMYQSSMRLSENFTREFKDFWALPDDFSL